MESASQTAIALGLAIGMAKASASPAFAENQRDFTGAQRNVADREIRDLPIRARPRKPARGYRGGGWA